MKKMESIGDTDESAHFIAGICRRRKREILGSFPSRADRYVVFTPHRHSGISGIPLRRKQTGQDGPIPQCRDGGSRLWLGNPSFFTCRAMNLFIRKCSVTYSGACRYLNRLFAFSSAYGVNRCKIQEKYA